MNKFHLLLPLLLVLNACTQKSSDAPNPPDQQIIELNAKSGIITGTADFGSFLYNATNTKLITFTLNNTGSEPLTGPATVDNLSQGFSLSYSNCPASLAVGKSCSLKVVFDPRNLSGGSYAANLNFDSIFVAMVATKDSPPAPESISLLGQIQYQVSSVAVTAVDFGEIAQKDSVLKTLTLKNIGSGPVAAKTITLTGTDFVLAYDACSGKSLAKGSSCTIKVSLSGTGKEGLMSSTLSFGDVSVALAGKVITPALAANDASSSLKPNLIFLDSAVEITSKNMGSFSGTQSAQAILSIKNTGNLVAASSSVVLSNSASFSIVYNQCDLALAINQSCQVRILFNSTGKSAGIYSSNLNYGGKSLAISAEVMASAIPVVTYQKTWVIYSSACLYLQPCAGLAYNYTVDVACKKYINGVYDSLADPSLCTGYNANPVQGASCSSPAGDKIVTILNGTQTVHCAAGSSVQSIVSTACSSNFHNSSNTCVADVISYAANYSAYGSCSALNACDGVGLQERTISSCQKLRNGIPEAGGSVGDCSAYSIPANLQQSCQSPGGNKVTNITNGESIMTCAAGEMTGGVEIVCTSGFNLVSGNCVAPVTNDKFYLELADVNNSSPTGKLLVYSDGTQSGTKIVRNSSGELVYPTSLLASLVWQNKLYLSVYDPTYNSSVLFATDSTQDGTRIVSTTNGANPGNLTLLHDKLYFTGTQIGFTSRFIFASDGSDAGTSGNVFKPNGSSMSNTNPEHLKKLNDNIIFSAMDGANGYIIWKLTDTATVMNNQATPLIDLAPNSSNSSPLGPSVELNNKLYFAGYNGTNFIQLWATDGSLEGTEQISMISHDNEYTGQVSYITKVDNKLFFTWQGTRMDSSTINELWSSDGTINGTQLVAQTYSGPYLLTAVGSNVFFLNDDGEHGYELWVSDGSESGTHMVKDIKEGMDGGNLNWSLDSSGSAPSVLNNKLFFTRIDYSNPQPVTELWVSDGTDSGTFKLKDLGISGVGPDMYNQLMAQANNKIYFQSYDDGSLTLWQTDGTVSGTTLAVDFLTVLGVPIILGYHDYCDAGGMDVIFGQNSFCTSSSTSLNLSWSVDPNILSGKLNDQAITGIAKINCQSLTNGDYKTLNDISPFLLNSQPISSMNPQVNMELADSSNEPYMSMYSVLLFDGNNNRVGCTDLGFITLQRQYFPPTIDSLNVIVSSNNSISVGYNLTVGSDPISSTDILIYDNMYQLIGMITDNNQFGGLINNQIMLSRPVYNNEMLHVNVMVNDYSPMNPVASIQTDIFVNGLIDCFSQSDSMSCNDPMLNGACMWQPSFVDCGMSFSDDLSCNNQPGCGWQYNDPGEPAMGGWCMGMFEQGYCGDSYSHF